MKYLIVLIVLVLILVGLQYVGIIPGRCHFILEGGGRNEYGYIDMPMGVQVCYNFWQMEYWRE